MLEAWFPRGQPNSVLFGTPPTNSLTLTVTAIKRAYKGVGQGGAYLKRGSEEATCRKAGDKVQHHRLSLQPDE
jgi:hypothetical protein